MRPSTPCDKLGARLHRPSCLGVPATSVLLALAPAILLSLAAATAAHAQVGEFSLERWAKLTETQRYQLQIAEKYFREKNYKVAASEYEKYLTLYESSEGAAYAQLQWSVCHVALRQSNTAITDGFQSVLDYWPESPEAVAAAYYIGNTYMGMGRIPQAKKALRAVVSNHPDQLPAVHAINDLISIADQEEDAKARVELLKTLTFDVKRNKPNHRICLDASRTLAATLLSQGAFAEAAKSLATSYEEGLAMDNELVAHTLPAIRALATEETQGQCDKLAAAAINYLSQKAPAPTDDETKAAALQYWLHIASIHVSAKHLEEAPKTYEQAFAKFGPNDDILKRLAEWHKSQGEYDQARAVFRRYADTTQGLSEVAYSYRQQNNIDPAVQTYGQLASQDVENAVKWKGEIGATYRGARKYQEAIAQYEALMAEDIENAEKWRWQVATAYEDWGKYPEAIGHYRQCTNFPENYKHMAWCNRKLNKPQEAIILYNQVMTDAASAPWAMLQVGYTREEAGQKEQAIKTFQLVCKQFPKHQYASTAHAILQDKYKISVTLGGGKDE